ncbi:MAG: efflux RND transporter periplasmic adaptor subunit [Planctomycetota bacterium]
MRSFVAYVLALLAVCAGVWFGFFSKNDVEGKESRRAAGATPVILAPVVDAPFADKLAALGTAVANESVTLTANRSDLVKAIHFDDGQQVEKDQVLLELQTAEEQSMLAEAKALMVEREAAHERAVELNGQGISPNSEVQTTAAQLNAARSRVQTLEATIRDHVVRAPFAGVLGLRRVSVGSLLQSSTVITTLDDLSVVKVDFTLPETWLAAVRVGQPVQARSDAWPEEVFVGKVSAIDTRLDRRTRSATIRAIVDNKDLKLRPGMLMKVDVDRGEAASRQVPEEALIQKGEQHFVYVVGDDTVAREVVIDVGRRQVGRVEVLGGLEVGQRVVVEGLVRVRDGSKVQVVAVRDGDKQ